MKKRTKTIAVLMFLQIGILVFACIVLDGSKPIKPEQIKEIEIIVDETKYSSEGKRTDIFFVISNGEEYSFPSTLYPQSKLNEMIKPGDKLCIMYKDGVYLYGFMKVRDVIDAVGNDMQYVSYEKIREDRANSFTIAGIVFIVVEFLFLVAISIYVTFYIRSKRVPKNLNEQSSLEESANSLEEIVQKQSRYNWFK